MDILDFSIRLDAVVNKARLLEQAKMAVYLVPSAANAATVKKCQRELRAAKNSLTMLAKE